jgi:Flp pilus assembly pilin Flp
VIEIVTRLRKLLILEHGQALAEYSLILLGIALACIISLTLLGGAITGPFYDLIDQAGFGGS